MDIQKSDVRKDDGKVDFSFNGCQILMLTKTNAPIVLLNDFLGYISELKLAVDRLTCICQGWITAYLKLILGFLKSDSKVSCGQVDISLLRLPDSYQ